MVQYTKFVIYLNLYEMHDFREGFPLENLGDVPLPRKLVGCHPPLKNRDQAPSSPLILIFKKRLKKISLLHFFTKIDLKFFF